MKRIHPKKCRFIPDVSVTAQDQVIDLNRLLHNVDPYLQQQFLRLGTYDANVDINSDIDYFDTRDFDFCDIFEYEKAINMARFRPKNEADKANFEAAEIVSNEHTNARNDSTASDGNTGESTRTGFQRK